MLGSSDPKNNLKKNDCISKAEQDKTFSSKTHLQYWIPLFSVYKIENTLNVPPPQKNQTVKTLYLNAVL